MTTANRVPHQGKESGNVLIYVFVAIALFGALGFAVTYVERGGKSGLDKEQARLQAVEAIQFGIDVKAAMNRMDAWITEDNQYNFSAPGAHADYGVFTNTSKYEVFGAAGGQMQMQPPPVGMNDGSPYEFSIDFEVSGVKTTMGSFMYAELNMFLFNLTLDACNAINDKLGYGWTSPPVSTFSSSTITPLRYNGVWWYTGSLQEASIIGKRAFCFREKPGGAQRYIFVYVLRER